MSDLNFKPETPGLRTGDKLISVPALDDAAAVGAAARGGSSGRAVRRRFNVTRLAQPIDDGFRPFRVY
ncbi:MAG TPA: hypothetical protein VHN17_03250 [Steroidobacteraceae bacterium]|jgi:hypothetical protein|nr:hypothetical protein [Steroidobacteraceae bacterium]